MRRVCGQSAGCSREAQSRRGGRCGGRLFKSAMSTRQKAERPTQRLLLEEQEASINQLHKLGQVVEVVENNQLICPPALVLANGKKQPLPRDNGNQLLREEHQQYPTDSGQVEVVELEQEVQLERLALAHQFPPTEDYNVVCEEGDGGGLERGHGRLAGLEAEVLRLVADNGLERSFEEGPQLEAKGAVERGDAIVDDGGLAHSVR
jgi:hypothetical protein